MDKGPWDNFLNELVNPAYLRCVALTSLIFTVLCIWESASIGIILTMMVLPWALYGLCSGVSFLVFYLFFLVWSKFK